jgi:hypothetical protein
MTDFKYTFLPFLRQGLAALITTEDNLASGVALAQERAKVKVKLTAKGENVSNGQEATLQFDGTNELVKEASLYGPRDITGIGRDAIVRTDPLDWNTNFESNFLPYIEFWDEDFPWRYTPLSPNNANNTLPDSKKKLRPWLALVVLKDEEFEKVSEFNGILPAFKAKAAFNTCFPDEKSLWAWSHVHINGELTGDVNTALSSLKGQLEAQPALAVSRIMSPRKLDENTAYHCFLIPSFETGRLAGLGQTVTSDLQQPSWSWTNTAPVPDVEFPYYYEWYFRTGKGGDFESLAELLQPVALDPALIGKREMDIQTPSPDFYTVDIPAPYTVPVSGALRPASGTAPNDDWWNPPSGYDPSDFKEKLVEVLNTSTNYLTQGTSVDPVITPPIYGRWHAKVNQLVDTKSDWLHKINLDPKLRVIAGAGAEAVKKHQEQFMQIAWEQVKDIDEANRLLCQLEFGETANTSAYDRSYLTCTDEGKMLITTGVHARVSVDGNTNTVFQDTAESTIPTGCFSGEYRKASRPNGFLSKNFSLGNSLSAPVMISNLNSGSVVVANAFATPMGANLYTAVSDPELTSSFTMSQPGRPDFALTNPSNIFYAPGNGMMDSPMALQFRSVAAVVHDYIGAPVMTYTPPQLNITDTAGTITSSIDPATTLLNVANNLVSRQDGMGLPYPVYSIAPVMACPSIKTPVFNYLYELSPDLVCPNLNALPQNSVSLFELNKDVIESFMVGMNHEMAAELLWREYPTDQRGTVFRRFWGSYNAPEPTVTEYEKSCFIKKIHEWRINQSTLTNLGVNQPAQFNPSNVLVLAIRGELLKKYPNTIVYAQKAKWQKKANNIDDDPDKSRIPTGLEADTLMPLFFSQAADIAFFGFDLDKTVARGTAFPETGSPVMTQPGWFFIFKEMIGEVHYGLDEFTGTTPFMDPGDLLILDEFNWEHMGNTVEEIKFIDLSVALGGLPSGSVVWNENAANIAYTTLRKPAYICIHAKELILS